MALPAGNIPAPIPRPSAKEIAHADRHLHVGQGRITACVTVAVVLLAPPSSPAPAGASMQYHAFPVAPDRPAPSTVRRPG
jgi:hypothetical protein